MRLVADQFDEIIVRIENESDELHSALLGSLLERDAELGESVAFDVEIVDRYLCIRRHECEI